MMFLEALSAVADDLSYTQDRIAAEATLMTATQRRSVVRHARLVDYEPTPPVSAQHLLQFEVAHGARPASRTGWRSSRPRPTARRSTFETGAGHCATCPPPPPASYALEPHAPTCPSPATGSTTAQRACRPARPRCGCAGSGWGFQPGQMLLIETAGENPGDPPIRQIVHLLAAAIPAGRR